MSCVFNLAVLWTRLPAQRTLNEDDGNEDDVGHNSHPAQAGQNYRRDLLILKTAFLFSILCATIVQFVKNGIHFNFLSSFVNKLVDRLVVRLEKL